MKKKALISLVSCTYLLGFSGVSMPVWCAPLTEQQPSLISPEKSTRGPSDIIRIRIPGLSATMLQRLAFELDDIDVTSLISTKGNIAIFNPAQPLSWGHHQLRLVENALDGNIVERGLWTLEVRKSKGFREASYQANSTLNLVQRVFDRNLVSPPGSTQVNGSAQLQGKLANGNWRATGNMDLFYSSQGDLLSSGGSGLDMGQFLFTGETGPFIAKAGHHAVGLNSMIMQNFNRRGISGEYQSKDKGTSANVFSVNAQEVTGFRGGFGVSDSGNRVNGVTISGRPITSRRDALVVSATYLAGEDPGQTGDGIGGDSLTATKGSATSLIADGNLLDKRLRLRGEVASSEFDFDGPGTGNPAENDQAYSALINYTPWHNKIVKNKPMAWNLGLESKRIGTFFRSTANPQGVADRNLIRGFTGFNWSGIDIQASIATETDNVNNLGLLPRIGTTQSVLTVSYVPEQDLTLNPDGQAPKMPWYGQPFYNVTYFTLDQDVEKAGAGLSNGAFHATDSFTLSATFSYSKWSWAISHTIGKDEDFTNVAVDTESKLIDLSANIQIGQKLSLTPTMQHSVVDDKDNNITTTLGTGGLSLNYIFSEKVTGSVGININSEKASDGSVNSSTSNLVGNIGWAVAKARGNRPTVALSLEGQLNELKDSVNPSSNTDSFQIFVKAILSW